MDQGIQGLQSEWQFVRYCSKCFVSELADADLDRRLPRKGLDTLRKHLEEMVSVQSDYVNAIETRVIEFSGPADVDVPGVASKEQLLAAMAAADARMAGILANTAPDVSIKWFAEQHPLTQHLSALIAHETLHIGQMVAFCYMLGIAVPNFVKEEWALSGS